MPRERVSQAVALLAYVSAVSLPFVLYLALGMGRGGTAVKVLAFICLQVAGPMLALQPVLAARLKVLDRIFGLDNVYLFHKTMGMTAGALLFLAAVLMISEAATYASMMWFEIPLLPALFAIGLVASALLYKQLGLGYELWRLMHNFGALATIGLLFFQAMFVMDAVGAIDKAVWVLFLIAGGSFYAGHKFIGPMRRRKNPFRVEDVSQESHNVWTLRIRPPEGEKRFGFRPGQFQFLTFMSQGLPSEEHPFTIASSPSAQGWHASSIKESGDFTSLIGRVKAGDPIAVQAPFGRFSYTFHPGEKDLVLIAGGIGITPLMSMLRHMRDSKADIDVLLLYANRKEEDIVFGAELDEIARGAAPRLRVVHVLSRASDAWQGERGRIDASAIKRHAEGDVKGKAFYVCGPPPMMASLIADIIGLGVPSSKVRSERFAL